MQLTKAQREALVLAARSESRRFNSIGFPPQSVKKLVAAGLIEYGYSEILPDDRAATQAMFDKAVKQATEALTAGHWAEALAHLKTADWQHRTLESKSLYITEAGRKAVAEC